MLVPEPSLVQLISEVLRDLDVLEPWLTESHWDENYWDDEALAVANRIGEDPNEKDIADAILAVLTRSFPGFGAPGGFRDDYRKRVRAMAATIRASLP